MKRIMMSAVALLVAGTAQATNNDYYWIGGGADADWNTAANWLGGSTPANDDYAYIDGHAVSVGAQTAYISATYITNGSVTVNSGGHLRAAGGGNFHSTQIGIGSGNAGSYNVTGGTGEVRWSEVGKDVGSTGIMTVSGGTLKATGSPTPGGFSLFLGANVAGTDAGTGSLVISGDGTLEITDGVRLGSSEGSGTGNFGVLGSSGTMSIGSWEQNGGSTLDLGVDAGGLSVINISTGPATFESGAFLDVDYFNGGAGVGTWTVMEVAAGDIVDNGLAFAAGVDTDIWSFAVDNSGANGVLTVTAIPEPGTLGLIAAFGGGILLIRRRFTN